MPTPNYEDILSEFDKLSPEFGKWKMDRNLARSFIQQALTLATERAVGKERGAWINGERCSTCGEPMEKTGLSDTCIRCFEDN